MILAAVFLGLAVAGFINIQHADTRLAVVLVTMVFFCINAISVLAAMRRQPMLKVLDDRFSIYTPFGYAMVRFGEVLSFRKGGVPGLRTLRVEINQAAEPRFRSRVSRALYALTWLNFANSVSIQGYMLGAELDPVIRMLENRREAAVRMDGVEGYDPRAATVAG
ncbi:hypothetical protein GM415_16460 [Pseudodesulfovibrio cashew]|uniref:Uncharacterized protein n=1 Tax=Pseudodesulfovibrio cashew TaxID=2678688 RepID=A0A6I6JFN8_9BACT|nr:hypothetical protein [Pseudodesulfovibrio cashew]QGY41645.1 hypothetical protein GM415_16460 [Pseudodesulfovibrio cashew]